MEGGGGEGGRPGGGTSQHLIAFITFQPKSDSFWIPAAGFYSFSARESWVLPHLEAREEKVSLVKKDKVILDWVILA